jgi:tripartite-type tricarboxylate transporter receptor subunit TctC
VVSAATPKQMQAALHEAVARSIDTPEIKERLARDGSEPFIGDTPAQYGAFIRSEIEKWRKIIRQAGIQAQ